ncbi:MAG: DMT family transporter [Actinomycetota bacterium]|nr:DMT family transporter [Actinomycetota bacterium]
MRAADLLSYLLAAIAAFGNALANVMQRKASLQQPADEPFSGRMMLSLLRNPTWIIGFGGMVASFGFQAVALGLGQLSAVEPIITLEVPLTLLVASRVFNGRLGRQEWTSIMLMTGGMIALVAALNPRPGQETHINHVTYVLAGGGTVATIAMLVAVSRAKIAVVQTACLGAAAGTSFGLTATLIKETVSQFTADGFLAILVTWQTYVAITFGVLGVLLMQWALHTGPLLAAQPGFTLMDPLVSILWGVLVYHELTRTGGWLALATAGGLGVGFGVALLARSPLFDPTEAALATTSEPG